MSTTTISGSINGVNNTALANKWITFRLVQLGTDSGATATVAQSVDSVQTDANGDFSIDVWNNGDSGKTSVLEITIDGSKPESVIIPTGTVSIELWDLIENYQADGSTSEQVPVVSDLFLRKSTNLSDLGSAATARTNLGVAIGTNVQAHSAALDATTASFTTADEIKLDGIEALADVTDATNIAASGGYVAGGTDVTLTDGGTGASDAPTARTNLGVAIGSDVQAHSAVLDATTASFLSADEAKLDGIEALADVTDATNIAANGGYVAGGTDVALTDGGTGASDAPTARTNLGLVIGSDVQAHSTVLDATTASFTGADETKLDGIEALADVTDATNIAASGGYVAGGTDVALTDGGTGASDAPTARANLGVPSESDTLLKSGNLLGLTDTAAARANLGVPSASEGLSIANNLSELTPTASVARVNIDVPSTAEAVLVANNLSEVDPVMARANLGVSSSQEGLAVASNLSELSATASTARTNLGVPSIAEAVLVVNNLSEVNPAIARINLEVPSTSECLAAANNLSELTATASTARTNIDVPSNAETVLVANNLSDVDPVIARANLGVPSTQEGLSAANNLSELTPTSSTARTNLGVAIGTDVQAHSAVLDATDVSFTTAKDAAISANTANIASNDTDIGTLTGSVVQNQTDITTNSAAIALNTAKVTNATHTGDVTGDAVLTIAPSAVDIPMLSATGTPSATSYLRGDNTWSVPDSSGLIKTDSLWNNEGDLAVGTGDDTAARLEIGLDNQVLTADSASPLFGMKWASLPVVTGDVATDSIWDAKGDLAASTGPDASDRLAIGANAQVLTVDSAEATGMKWSTPGTVTNDLVWDAKGDLVGGTGSNTATRLTIGTNNSVLTADSTEATGMKWSEPSGKMNIVDESTAARSLSLTDANAYIRLTNALSCNITVPTNATVDWAGVDWPPSIYFRVAAAGIPTMSNIGVTVNDTLGVLATLEEGSTFALQWVASDVWDII
jgi:hypothetical protein